MLSCDFHAGLKKLNRLLWIDEDREANPFKTEFPCAGLYLDGKFLFGVPHNYVPEYSIVEINSGRLLARGYKYILSELAHRGIIDQRKAERIFSVGLEPGRQNFPYRYIDLGFEKG